MVAGGAELCPARTIRTEDDSLFEESQTNPQRVRAILQSIGALFSPDFIALAWRLQHGDSVISIKMGYQAKAPFKFEVEVRETDSAIPQAFATMNLRDIRLFRHTGISGNSTLAGFYALKR